MKVITYEGGGGGSQFTDGTPVYKEYHKFESFDGNKTYEYVDEFFLDGVNVGKRRRFIDITHEQETIWDENLKRIDLL